MKHFLVFVSLVALTAVGSGCHAAATAPTQPPPTAVTPTPTIATITPNVGTTGGGTSVTIAGTGFTMASTVTFGGAVGVPRFDSRSPSGLMYVKTPPQPAGVVDVIVTNPRADAAVVKDGFSYRAPQAFDFNGTWSGFGDAGQDIPLGFTIRDNTVVSVSCDTFSLVTFAAPVIVENGEFSFSDGCGANVAGRILSASTAAGTMNIAACTNTNWNASRR
jgi:hypothetical protein